MQILGAFVVRDGAPLQGMKVKNVVPGKIQMFFLQTFEAIDRPYLDISLFTTLETPQSLMLTIKVSVVAGLCEIAHEMGCGSLKSSFKLEDAGSLSEIYQTITA